MDDHRCQLDEVEAPMQQLLWEEAKRLGVAAMNQIIGHVSTRGPRYSAMVADWKANYTHMVDEIYNLQLVCINRKSRVAGKAKLLRSIVEINCWLIEDVPNFRDTVLHEVAHHVTRLMFPVASGHGPEWRAIASHMGADPHAATGLLPAEKAKQLRRGTHYVATCRKGHRAHVGPRVYKEFVKDPIRFRCPHCHENFVQIEPDV